MLGEWTCLVCTADTRVVRECSCHVHSKGRCAKTRDHYNFAFNLLGTGIISSEKIRMIWLRILAVNAMVEYAYLVYLVRCSTGSCIFVGKNRLWIKEMEQTLGGSLAGIIWTRIELSHHGVRVTFKVPRPRVLSEADDVASLVLVTATAMHVWIKYMDCTNIPIENMTTEAPQDAALVGSLGRKNRTCANFYLCTNGCTYLWTNLRATFLSRVSTYTTTTIAFAMALRHLFVRKWSIK